jgi:D-alanyl-D-alanine carboxypeptidase/D-alanyl-D-alanine-endopeptidase (penicillin-binding protein 4)
LRGSAALVLKRIMRLTLILAAAVLFAAPPPEAEAVARKPVAKAPVRIPTKRRIDLLLATEAAKNARWGIHVVSLKTGAVVYQMNPEDRLSPASNTKLFSTALALERLGPDYQFITTIRADQAVDSEGVIRGDIRLVGGGDPTLSGRAYPYRKDSDVPVPPNPLEPMEQLAESLVQRGVKEIRGDVVGDDRLFVWAPYPEGWTVDDSIWEYGAPVSALPFNDSAFTLVLRPGEAAGDPAFLSVNPPSIPLTIDSRVTTAADGRAEIQIDRLPGSQHIRVYGNIPLKSNGVRQLLAVDDAALYAAHVLHDVLTRRGIQIHGSPVALHRWNADEPFDPSYGVELARRASPPLVEVARVVNKVSQNLHAEILLREVARLKQDKPTREAGLKELGAFLTGLNIDAKSYHFEDGSGLSRRTLVAPATVTRLLTYMNASKNGEAWDSLLPVGADDGTLRLRFEKSTKASAIHAKTGTLATTNALSGYLTTARGARLAFSIIANNHTVPSSEIRKVIDRIGLALLEWEGL